MRVIDNEHFPMGFDRVIASQRLPENIWIIAGSYAQYLHYMHKFRDFFYSLGKHNDYNFKYLSEPDKLRGRRREKYIRVGTWQEIRRRDLEEINILLRHLEFEEIEYDDGYYEERERYEREYQRSLSGNFFVAEEEFISKEEMTI